MRKFLAAAAATAILATSLIAPSAHAAEASAILFKDDNGKGESRQVTDSVTDLGSFSDKASSIFVVNGKFELCNDAGYKGACATFGQGLHNLGSLSDKVTSIRPVSSSSNNGDDGDGVILLFTDRNGNGKVVRLTESVKNLSSSYSGFNDTVSSVAIFDGTWKLCKSKDYGGSCTTLGAGVYNLDSYNDSITSIRVSD